MAFSFLCVRACFLIISIYVKKFSSIYTRICNPRPQSLIHLPWKAPKYLHGLAKYQFHQYQTGLKVKGLASIQCSPSPTPEFRS